MGILYLHGAGMSERSFTLFRKAIRKNSFCPSYHVDTGLAQNIETIEQEARAFFNDKPVDIVAHSMGGLIALALLKDGFPIRRIVTMSTPFGGSVAASSLKWFYPSHKMFRDIEHTNDLIHELKSQQIEIPMKCFVTIGGHSSLKLTENDGVVSVKSQKDLSGPVFEEVDINHFEILLSDHVIQKTKEFLK